MNILEFTSEVDIACGLWEHCKQRQLLITIPTTRMHSVIAIKKPFARLTNSN